MFTLLADGHRPTRVAEELNENGFRTKRRELRTRHGETKLVGGNYFNCDTVITMARNPIYIGKVRHGEEIREGQHEGIVSGALF